RRRGETGADVSAVSTGEKAMVRMRAEQMEVFRSLAESAFENRVVAHLRLAHADILVRFPQAAAPVKDVPVETLQALVRRGIARGRAYGLTWQSSLGGFVVLAFVAAPNFDAHPLVRRVLRDDHVPADLRLGQLWKRTTKKTWETISQRYDPAAWEQN